MTRTTRVIVYIGEPNAAETLAEATGWLVLPAATFKQALAQVIFSYPDAVVADATEDVLRAEDSYFHLRSIDHPPVLILSDVPGRWDIPRHVDVTLLTSDSDVSERVDALHDLMDMAPIRAE